MEITPCSQESTCQDLFPEEKKSPPWYESILAKIPKSEYKFGTEQLEDEPEDRRDELDLRLEYEAKRLINQRLHPKAFIQHMFDDDTLTMRGVGILAHYLRTKKNLTDLYVCTSMEAFQLKLKEISQTKGDIRQALILAKGFETDDEISPSYYGANPSHKIAVCIEKTDTSIKIAILDPLGISDEISPAKITAPAHDLKDKDIYGLDAVLWYIAHTDLPLDKTHIFYSSTHRQKSYYGCETFALRDGVSFLLDPNFFNKIQGQFLTFEENGIQLSLGKITTLPPEFMKGTQSLKTLAAYIERYLGQNPDLKELESLLSSVQKHTIYVGTSLKNNYIFQKSYKYHLLAIETLKSLPTAQLIQDLEKSLVFARRPFPAVLPETLSDLHLLTLLN